MKEYNDYLNKIEVSNSLHEKIMSTRKDKKRPIFSLSMVGIAIIVLILSLNFFTRDLDKNIASEIPTSPSANLIFEAVNYQQADFKLYIPGHFWLELSKEEIQSLITLPENVDISYATANFSSENKVATLFNIVLYGSKDSIETSIQIAQDFIRKDYILTGEENIQSYNGIQISTGIYTDVYSNLITVFANFMLDSVAYEVELTGEATNKDIIITEMNQLLATIIDAGPAPLTSLNPTVPELRNDVLNLEEAKLDEQFGMFVPTNIPPRFSFDQAIRTVDQVTNSLFMSWYQDMDSITWRVSKFEPLSMERIVTPDQEEKYDFRLYTVPLYESVPSELQLVVDSPIFQLEDISLDIIHARSLNVEDTNDSTGIRIHFSILINDTIIDVRSKGLTAEELMNIINEMK